MPRARFTVRALMIAVAVVALTCGVLERRRRFARISAEHAAAASRADNPFRITKKELWHRILAIKYELAADRPWLPVAPDPPEPE